MHNLDVYVRSQDVVTRRIGAEILVVPVRSGVGDLGSIYSLNEMGSFIWEKLAEPVSINAIVDAIIAAYEISSENALRDVKSFLVEMRSASLAEKKSQTSFLSQQSVEYPNGSRPLQGGRDLN